MASTVEKTIILKGRGIRKERIANAAITPGHLVELMTTNKLRVHATAGGNCQKAFAVENDLIGGTIDTAYATNAQVQYEVMERGSEVNAILKNGENVAIGDFLESAGNGELQKHVADVDLNHPGSADFTVYTNQIVAVALQAVNMSGSSDADPSNRIKVEIL